MVTNSPLLLQAVNLLTELGIMMEASGQPCTLHLQDVFHQEGIN